MDIHIFPNVELASGELIQVEIAQYDQGLTHVTVGPHEDYPDLALHEQRREIVQALIQQEILQASAFRYFEAQVERDEGTGDWVLQHYQEVPWDLTEREARLDRSRYVRRHTPEQYESIQETAQRVARAPVVEWAPPPEPEMAAPYFSLDP